MTTRISKFTALLIATTLMPVTPLLAQDNQKDDDESAYQDIVVTASRVRQGGAQDIKHFRAVAAEDGMPRPESLTVEGLMGEHDLNLTSDQACGQLFCLVTEAMPAGLATRPNDKLFVGLGFTSNIDAAKWHREPLNLVAVVDKSGSMSGSPLELVRQSLRKIVGQMTANDRFSIVLYGDRSHVFLAPTTIGGNRGAVLAAISDIQSAGSTNMEAGLQVGYDTAFADAPGFKGNTRLMLFTDEQPNVGATDATSFMGMAEAASKRGIGLTTIGVGVQYDGALASKISSVRGGNLFFMANEDDVKSVFEKQLDTMVSELAHDVRITMRPVDGYKISGVFGVPGDTMTETPDGAVAITVPTAFLSTNGGGIFLTLAKASDRENLPPANLLPSASLLNVALSYTSAHDGKAGEDQVAVAVPGGSASAPLRTANMLVDEYLVLKDASMAFHIKGDPKTAYRLLNGLSGRLDSAGLEGMQEEKKLVGDMLAQAALYSGYAGEGQKPIKHLTTIGTWEITGVEGMEDLHRGDRLSFTSDREMLTYRKKEGFDDPDETEDYEINERQVHLVDSHLVFDYRTSGNHMVLSSSDLDGTARISLKRIVATGME
jgi:Ca-activated chloride channel homolog